MDKTQRCGHWLVTYAVLCSLLCLGANVSAQLSDWSTSAVGGIPCNSQANLITGLCEQNPNYMPGTCVQEYDLCNQNQGTRTKLCEKQGGSRACTSDFCLPRHHDRLSDQECEEIYK